MMRSVLAGLFLCALSGPMQAQWVLQDSGVPNSMRGIHALEGGRVAWASGTRGTVIRTVDGGAHWTKCGVPAGAEMLDFRGVQAFDEKTAVVMSSGTGDASRIYGTRDGCTTWRLLLRNPDEAGFFDGLKLRGYGKMLTVVGDSVDALDVDEKLRHMIRAIDFDMDTSPDDDILDDSDFFQMKALAGESSFAASNSTLVRGNNPPSDGVWRYAWLATATPDKAIVHRVAVERTKTCEPCVRQSLTVEVPMSQGVASAGIFSLAFTADRVGVAVGGDYQKPNETAKTAAWTTDAGASWTLSTTSPSGYRSSVAYQPWYRTWIAVGPNGTDISTDDGKNWRALKPGPGDAPDADKKWNALSLPFVVGDRGRIGKLRDGVLR